MKLQILTVLSFLSVINKANGATTTTLSATPIAAPIATASYDDPTSNPDLDTWSAETDSWNSQSFDSFLGEFDDEWPIEISERLFPGNEGAYNETFMDELISGPIGEINVQSRIIHKRYIKAFKKFLNNENLHILLGKPEGTPKEVLKAKAVAAFKLMFQRKKYYPNCTDIGRHFHGVCVDQSKNLLQNVNRFDGTVFRTTRVPLIATGVTVGGGSFVMERLTCSENHNKIGPLAGKKICKRIQHTAYMVEALSMAVTLYGARGFHNQNYGRTILWAIAFLKHLHIVAHDMFIVTHDNRFIDVNDERVETAHPYRCLVVNYEHPDGGDMSIAFYPYSDTQELGFSLINKHFRPADFSVEHPHIKPNPVPEPAQPVEGERVRSTKRDDDDEEDEEFVPLYYKFSTRFEVAVIDHHLDFPNPVPIRNNLNRIQKRVQELLDFWPRRFLMPGPVMFPPNEIPPVFYEPINSAAIPPLDITLNVASINGGISGHSVGSNETFAQEDGDDVVGIADERFKMGFLGFKARVEILEDPVHDLKYWEDAPDYE